jgi:serine protease Do
LRYATFILVAVAGSFLAPFLASADVIEDANRFTVQISGTVEYPFGAENKGTATGAGFLIDRERGWILTNAHVARRAPAKLRINFKGLSPVPAERLFIDTHLDLAVLKIDPGKIPSSATVGSLDCGPEQHAGRFVVAFGHPWSLSYTATRGIISGTKSLEGVEMIQTDAALNPGNSGGPLIDETTGKIVGINVATLDKSKTEGMNFAVPANLSCSIIALLRAGRDPLPPNLPVQFAETPVDGELVIADVKDTWSDALKIGDRVVAVNGDTSAKYASRIIDKARQVAQLTFLIRRDGKEMTVSVNVPDERKNVQQRGVYVSGLLLAAPANSDEKIVTVQQVDRASLGEQALFRVLDIIHSINGRKVHTYSDILSALEGKKGQECEVIIKREVQGERDKFLFLSRRLEIDGPVEVHEDGPVH